MHSDTTIPVSLPDFLYSPELEASGIYSITCSANGRIYIGSAVLLSKRWRKHYSELLRGRHHNRILQNAWNKYGPGVFRFEVIEFVTTDLLIEREQFHLGRCDAAKRFNLSPTAGSIRGFKQSAETCELMRVQRLGVQVHSEETKARLSERFKGYARRLPGWKMTEEQKAKLREAKTGRPLSDEHKAKLAIPCIGWQHTEDARKKIAIGHLKFTPVQVCEMRAEYMQGSTMDQLAERYGARRTAISSAIRGVGLYGEIPGAVSVRPARTSAAKGKPGRKWTNEQRERQSLALKGNSNAAGHVKTEEVRQAQSERMKGNQHTKGRPLSDEHRAAVSATHNGRPKSPETRERMRLAALRRSPEHKAAISAALKKKYEKF